jgi:hypothetical protein
MLTDSPDRGSPDVDPREVLEAYRIVRARLKADPENADQIRIALRLRKLWETQSEDWLEPYDR